MRLSPAPFHSELVGGPVAGQAHWATCDDGVRIRVAHWRPQIPARGTVLMFPGRTEYIEKYDHTAQALTALGWAMVSVDWRGQGLADRLLPNRQIGHVGNFADYQRDVAAVLDVARQLDLPHPLHLLGHSMGGCIGLRAVQQGLPVASCAFTGPMWGILLPPHMRILLGLVSGAATALGLGHVLTPSTTAENYVLTQDFDGNTLTTDPQMYAMMRDHLTKAPDLGLGGPSLRWIRKALDETAALAKLAAPDLPCLTFLGTDEQIVDPQAIKDQMARWPKGTLEIVDGAQHEVLMEPPAMRDAAIALLDRHFTQNT